MMEYVPSRTKFLLVDDLEENLMGLEEILAKPELELLKASSTREALDLLLVHEVALAIIDVQMPEVSGLELTNLMRGSERTCHVPIILIGADTGAPAQASLAYDAGAVDFLIRPLDRVVFKRKAEVFFALDQQRRQLAQQRQLLQASEQYRSRRVESSQDHIAVLFKDGTIEATHGAAALPHEDLDWSLIWAEEARPGASKALAEVRKGKSVRFNAQTCDRASEWDIVLSPIRASAGDIERVLAVARNVTSQKQAERERERLTAELENNLHLNEMFVAAMTHDMRNPLNVIQLGIDSLEHAALAPRQQQVVARIRSANERLSRMLSNLFDLARSRLTGSSPIDRATVDVAVIAEKIVQTMEPMARPRCVNFEQDGDVTGEWDGSRIEQVLWNLLGNAIEHGDAETPISVRLIGSSDELLLSVHNGGVVPEPLRGFVFEPFRSGRTREGQRGPCGPLSGVGLGLYIVKQIALAHGGDALMQSCVGAGTTIQVRFPRAPSANVN